MKEKAKEIGLKLKMKRIEKGFNQYDLADLVGVKNVDISAYEKGRTLRIPTETFFRLCSVLGLTPESLDPDRFGRS